MISVEVDPSGFIFRICVISGPSVKRYGSSDYGRPGTVFNIANFIEGFQCLWRKPGRHIFIFAMSFGGFLFLFFHFPLSLRFAISVRPIWCCGVGKTQENHISIILKTF